ncbi:putative receptor protein kinase TMK1-like [Hibiscus syriacus]|uniref:Receptor protein kinase TMK1-like n=1 Tax=Hibiscus syriacus TaxID=106335 RepID=A0A6A3D8A4_HIBSY|nr:putative receptor protein kinase TMK1-like [Hibiscus syriacus]
MRLARVEPNHITFVTLLSGCAEFPLKEDVMVGTALLEMYAKGERVEVAKLVFDLMRVKNSVLWNTMIDGCIRNREFEKAVEIIRLCGFDRMQNRILVSWNSIIGGFAANGFAGLVDDGLCYFDIMKRVYRISTRIEHFGCIVDLYSRSWELKEVWNVVQNMPMKPNEVVLGSLLAACRNHGDIRLAKRIVKNLVALDPGSDSNYVLLSNIYAAVGRWEGASKVRRRMKALVIRKKPGFSSIEIYGCVHEFVAGDKSHREKDCIYATLELLTFDLMS